MSHLSYLSLSNSAYTNPYDWFLAPCSHHGCRRSIWPRPQHNSGCYMQSPVFLKSTSIQLTDTGGPQPRMLFEKATMLLNGFWFLTEDYEKIRRSWFKSALSAMRDRHNGYQKGR